MPIVSSPPVSNDRIQQIQSQYPPGTKISISREGEVVRAVSPSGQELPPVPSGSSGPSGSGSSGPGGGGSGRSYPAIAITPVEGEGTNQRPTGKTSVYVRTGAGVQRFGEMSPMQRGDVLDRIVVSRSTGQATAYFDEPPRAPPRRRILSEGENQMSSAGTNMNAASRRINTQNESQNPFAASYAKESYPRNKTSNKANTVQSAANIFLIDKPSMGKNINTSMQTSTKENLTERQRELLGLAPAKAAPSHPEGIPIIGNWLSENLRPEKQPQNDVLTTPQLVDAASIRELERKQQLLGKQMASSNAQTTYVPGEYVSISGAVAKSMDIERAKKFIKGESLESKLSGARGEFVTNIFKDDMSGAGARAGSMGLGALETISLGQASALKEGASYGGIEFGQPTGYSEEAGKFEITGGMLALAGTEAIFGVAAARSGAKAAVRISKQSSIENVFGMEGSDFTTGRAVQKYAVNKPPSTLEKVFGIKGKPERFDALITSGQVTKGDDVLFQTVGGGTANIRKVGSKNIQEEGFTFVSKGRKTGQVQEGDNFVNFYEGQTESAGLRVNKGKITKTSSGKAVSTSRESPFISDESKDVYLYQRRGAGATSSRRILDFSMEDAAGKFTQFRKQRPVDMVRSFKGSGGNTPFFDFNKDIHPMIRDLSGATSQVRTARESTASLGASAGLSSGERAAVGMIRDTYGGQSSSPRVIFASGVGVGSAGRMSRTQPGEYPVRYPSGGGLIFGKGVVVPDSKVGYPAGTDVWAQLGTEKINVGNQKQKQETPAKQRERVSNLYGGGSGSASESYERVIGIGNQVSEPRVANVVNQYTGNPFKITTRTGHIQIITPRMRQMMRSSQGRMFYPMPRSATGNPGRSSTPLIPGLPIFKGQRMNFAPKKRRKGGFLFWEKSNPVPAMRDFIGLFKPSNSRKNKKIKWI